MIVRNGGKFLAPLLTEARHWVDEIVIGDTGSIDDSRTVAEAAGARVMEVAWTNHFADARNAVLERCNGNWIIVLDADEQISARDWFSIRKWVQEVDATDQAMAVTFPIRNYMPKPFAKHGWQANPTIVSEILSRKF